MIRTRFLVGAATLAVVLLIFGAVILMRHRLTWQPPQDAVRFAEETRRHFRATPTAQAENRAAVVATLDTARLVFDEAYDRKGESLPFSDAAPVRVTEAQRAALLEAVAEIIELRASADVEAYASWMRSRGYTLKEPDELTLRQRRMFRIYAGRELSFDDTAWDIFKLAFEGELISSRGGSTRPDGISAAPDAVEIWFGSLADPDAASIHDAFSNALYSRMKEAALADPPTVSQMRWHTGQGYAGWSHWAPPRTWRDVIEREGEVLCAQVLCVFRTGDGGVTPTQFLLFFDPATNQWRLEDMAYVNTYEITLGLGPVF